MSECINILVNSQVLCSLKPVEKSERRANIFVRRYMKVLGAISVNNNFDFVYLIVCCEH